MSRGSQPDGSAYGAVTNRFMAYAFYKNRIVQSVGTNCGQRHLHRYVTLDIDILRRFSHRMDRLTVHCWICSFGLDIGTHKGWNARLQAAESSSIVETDTEGGPGEIRQFTGVPSPHGMKKRGKGKHHHVGQYDRSKPLPKGHVEVDINKIDYAVIPAGTLQEVYSALCFEGRLDDALHVIKQSIRAGRDDCLKKCVASFIFLSVCIDSCV